jgi:hypothetical protein
VAIALVSLNDGLCFESYQLYILALDGYKILFLMLSQLSEIETHFSFKCRYEVEIIALFN